jgi:hypothetical protein
MKRSAPGKARCIGSVNKDAGALGLLARDRTKHAQIVQGMPAKRVSRRQRCAHDALRPSVGAAMRLLTAAIGSQTADSGQRSVSVLTLTKQDKVC